MAVELKFFNSNLVAKTKAVNEYVGNAQLSLVVATGELAAADNDGSVYGLMLVKSNDRPVRITVGCDAITGGTDYELGLYEYDPTASSGIGAVVSKGLLMTGQTLASASKVLDGFANVDVANWGKTYWELLSLTKDSQKQYVLALTADTAGSGAGTVTVRAEHLHSV